MIFLLGFLIGFAVGVLKSFAAFAVGILAGIILAGIMDKDDK